MQARNYSPAAQSRVGCVCVCVFMHLRAQNRPPPVVAFGGEEGRRGRGEGLTFRSRLLMRHCWLLKAQ